MGGFFMRKEGLVIPEKYILDMDGTVYTFRGAENNSFAKSEFYGTIKSNAYRFLAETLGLSENEAIAEFNRIKDTYDGEISLGVENEYQEKYGIDRYTYFRATWDMDPTEYVETDGDVREAINMLQGRMALLTAAPKIWASRVLEHLKIDDLFTNVYTGEPDVRKPNPEIFRKIATDLNVDPTRVVSVGDQEYSDITPAKSIGMKGIIVGKEQLSADYRIDSIQQLQPLLKGIGWI